MSCCGKMGADRQSVENRRQPDPDRFPTHPIAQQRRHPLDPLDGRRLQNGTRALLQRRCEFHPVQPVEFGGGGHARAVLDEERVPDPVGFRIDETIENAAKRLDQLPHRRLRRESAHRSLDHARFPCRANFPQLGRRNTLSR